MRSLIRTDHAHSSHMRRRWRGAALLVSTIAGALAAQQPSAMLTPRPSYVVSFAPGGAPSEDSKIPVLLRQPITLSLKSVSAEQALRTIASRAGISLTYSRAVVPLDRTVSVELDNGSVLEALQQVLGNTSVELWVSPDGRMALVPAERAPAQPEVAAAGTLTGHVTAGQTGQPLSGATVTV